MTAEDLTLVGLSEDGGYVLLRDVPGTQYRVRLDAALRSVVRHERPRPVAVAAADRPQMSPREVQRLIRAGASTDEVAEVSGWSLDKIARYEGPVIAEREFVASLATQVRLHSMTGSTLLSARVADRLAARDVDPDEASWDAWRVEGRPWTLQLAFPAGGRLREARWSFDVQTRTVTPEDDEARWLSAEVDTRPAPYAPDDRPAVTPDTRSETWSQARSDAAPGPAGDASGVPDHRTAPLAAPSAARDDVHEPAAMSLEEAVEAVAPLQVEDVPAPAGDDLADAMRRRSAARRDGGLLPRTEREAQPAHPGGAPASPTAPAATPAEGTDPEAGSASPTTTGTPEPAREDTTPQAPADAPAPAAPADRPAEEREQGGERRERPAPEPQAPRRDADRSGGRRRRPAMTPEPPRQAPSRKKPSARPSVPSWDDIMFGSKKD